MTQTLSVNDISIQTVIKHAKNGDEIVLEENGKPIARITPIMKPNNRRKNASPV